MVGCYGPAAAASSLCSGLEACQAARSPCLWEADPGTHFSMGNVRQEVMSKSFFQKKTVGNNFHAFYGLPSKAHGMQWDFNVRPCLAWGFIPVLLHILSFLQSPVVGLRPREPQILGISACPEHLLGTSAGPVSTEAVLFP